MLQSNGFYNLFTVIDIVAPQKTVLYSRTGLLVSQCELQEVECYICLFLNITIEFFFICFSTKFSFIRILHSLPVCLSRNKDDIWHASST